MKSLKKQFAVALIAVLAIGAFTTGCNKTETAPAPGAAATNAVDSATSTNK